MSKVFQASRRLLKISQTCHGLARVIPVSQTDPMEYPLLTGAHHWRRKMRTTFRCLDANSDGYITKEDYAITARRCAQFLNLNDERAQHILNQRMAMWEIIPKGTEDPSKVSEEEYINSAPPVFNRNSFRQEFLPMVISMDFDAMDIDGDGLISNEEHKAFFYGLHIPVDESKKIYDVMDTNKDGLISIDEFAHAWTEFFLTEDPNNIYDVLFGKLAD
ncbi:sarcoplasmic calcium-binding protein-like [Lingula anatina]|uniref:Sarcoplasmic calcium-binding protein-like n=1 Tax=Lingula anatina TaxID=7574 RepID=A0A1S3IWU3_LINAN|nr:sarcoplasmic calcium-binding protein-like [Lingula anatina]|eukprot:XP_013402662.1 sarcoplasmic calcium-binding protein-like [Lingula anatina]